MENPIIKDNELVSCYIQGDETALVQLINRHQQKIFGYINMIVKDRQLAEDIFQETFFKVVRKLKSGSYNEEGKFLQWVMRIAHNLTIDHFRKSSRMPTTSGNENFDIFSTIKEDSLGVEAQMINDQIHSDIRSLVDLLPEEQREVVLMRHYQEFSFKEIAEATDVSINTALGRMRYALINLRKMIEEKNLIMTLD